MVYDLEVSTDDPAVAYVRVRSNLTGQAKVHRTISLKSLVPNLKGPSIYIDVADDGSLLGIELVGDLDDQVDVTS